MAAPMTRQYGHGNARDFAFPERRGRLAPYRAGKRVPRVGKNVEVIEAAAADYQELTRLLGEKEEAENLLMELMEQWEQASALME